MATAISRDSGNSLTVACELTDQFIWNSCWVPLPHLVFASRRPQVGHGPPRGGQRRRGKPRLSVGRNLCPSGASVETTEAAPITHPFGRSLPRGSWLRRRSSEPEDPLGRSPCGVSGGAALQFLAVPKSVQRFPSAHQKVTARSQGRQIRRIHCFRAPVSYFATCSVLGPRAADTYAPTRHGSILQRRQRVGRPAVR